MSKKRVLVVIGSDLLRRVRARVAGTGFQEKDWVLAAVRRRLDEEEGRPPPQSSEEPGQPEQRAPERVTTPPVAGGSPGF